VPAPVSRSSSIASLNPRKHVGSAVGAPVTSEGVPEECASQVWIIAFSHVIKLYTYINPFLVQSTSCVVECFDCYKCHQTC
jgi:hypothetical protein